MRDKKKYNIIVYSIIILLYYLVFELITNNFLGSFVSIIKYSKYGSYIIGEVSWLFFVLIAIYLSGDLKVIGEKKEGFFKTLLICFPLTLISILYTTTSIGNIAKASLLNILGLILYSFSIGLTEELLVRGWLLNKFFSKYGNKRKEVYLSILFSALIFGGMHISNIWTAGQTVSETLIQIVFATSAGIFFGAAFFRTRNIIALAFLHGFYDFSILLEDINLLRDCTTNPTQSITKYQLFITITRCAILIISALIIMRKSKTNHLFTDNQDEKIDIIEDNNKKSRLVIACIVIYFMGNSIPSYIFKIKDEDLNNYKTCYNYPEINLNNVETTYNNYYSYIIENDQIKYEFYLNNSKLILKTNNKEYEIAKEIGDFKIINNNDNYTIYYLKPEDNSSNSIVYYSNYLIKNKISNEDKYINDLKKSFNEQDMPPASTLGTIKENGYNYLFPMIKDYNNNLFLIDKKGIVRLVTTNKNKKSDLLEERDKELIKVFSDKYIKYVPFNNFINLEYLDAYRGSNINIDNIDLKNLLSYAYTTAKEEESFPVNSDNCPETIPCLANKYVSNNELVNKVKELYNKDIIDINNFIINNGVVELQDNHWLYFKKEDNTNIEKLSIIEKVYYENDTYIVEERAGFVYNDSLSKYSEISNSIVHVDSNRESLEKYFKRNKKQFPLFKHTFKYNESTEDYYYYSTENN